MRLKREVDRSGTVILLSPAPVDGYPPVQNQARLLADQGFCVELITMPRLSEIQKVEFNHTGVLLNLLPHLSGRGVLTIIRFWRFATTLFRLRWACRGRPLAEIAYDPLAMLVSDFTPLRPSLRIAHFHESLEAFDRVWLEKRLAHAIHGYQCVVVADQVRGVLLANQLRLTNLPFVVPNYPFRHEDSRLNGTRKRKNCFEVIYAGSIGTDQKISLLLEALHNCPDHIVLTLLGNRDNPTAKELLKRAENLGLVDRLHMPGWVSYSELHLHLARANLGVALLNSNRVNHLNSLGACVKRYEYMRAGLPQIGDMNPGVPELIEGNRIGRCVQGYSPRELAKLICEYAANPARCMEEGTHARKLHEEIFNYQTAFEPLLKLINNYLTNINYSP